MECELCGWCSYKGVYFKGKIKGINGRKLKFRVLCYTCLHNSIFNEAERLNKIKVKQIYDKQMTKIAKKVRKTKC